MLIVQMMIGKVPIERLNGRNHSRYHGYTTGAQNRDAAIGQAKASGGDSEDLLLIRAALRSPASIASPAKCFGDTLCSRAANSGPLNRKLCTYVPSDPMR